MSTTPEISEALEAVLNSRMADINTCFPGEIVSYSAENQTATIKPMVRRPQLSSDINEYEDEYETIPNIPNVPVAHPRGSNCSIHIPLQAGDSVIVVVTQHDMSQWRATGQQADPQTGLTHDLTSCFAIPGAFHGRQKLGSDAVSSSDITIVNGGFITTIKNNRIELGGSSDAAALASKVKNLETALISHTHTGVTVGTGVTGTSLQLTAPSYLPQTFDSDRIKTDS